MDEKQKLKNEIETWSFFAKTLIYSHQQNLHFEILMKIKNMKKRLKEL